MIILSEDFLNRVAAGADDADRSPDWPVASLDALGAAGVVAWAVPAEYDGVGLGPVELLRGNEAVAAACMTSAFILSQREAAIRRILAGAKHLRELYLPGLAAGDHFMTVGLSQLTTSRQRHGPALRATPSGTGHVLDGEIPWVTGADRATALVVGATRPDGAEVLFVLPTDRPGVTVLPPMALAALNGSRTSLVRCDGVEVGGDLLLAGPAERVLGTVGGGGLETSNLALGLAAAATSALREESASRPDLTSAADRFQKAIDDARVLLHGLAGAADPDQTLALRVECSRLALRASQAGLVAAKGSGFVVPHAAQRRARQALFFLVWSCPRPVAQGVLDDLLP